MSRRRITRAKIKHISLVPRGANQMPVIYKEDKPATGDAPSTGTVAFDLLTKAGSDFEERGELLAVVYAPEIRDSHGDIASASVIKEMMYDAAKEGVQIDIRHDEKPVEKSRAYIAENFLIQKGDARFSDFRDYNGKTVDVTGGWAVVIKIDDPELRKQYREGKWNGVSMGGMAEMVQEKSDTPPQGEKEMTPKEILDAIAKSNEALTTGIVNGINQVVIKTMTEAGLIKKADDTNPKKNEEPKAPVFKGNPSNPADVRKHLEAVKAFQLSKEIDWSDPEAVSKHLALMEEMAKAKGDQPTDEEAGIQKEDTAEVRVLKRQLATLQKASRQPKDDAASSGNGGNGGTDNSGGNFRGTTIDKAAVSMGSAMAAFANGTPQKQSA